MQGTSKIQYYTANIVQGTSKIQYCTANIVLGTSNIVQQTLYCTWYVQYCTAIIVLYLLRPILYSHHCTVLGTSNIVQPSLYCIRHSYVQYCMYGHYCTLYRYTVQLIFKSQHCTVGWSDFWKLFWHFTYIVCQIVEGPQFQNFTFFNVGY